MSSVCTPSTPSKSAAELPASQALMKSNTSAASTAPDRLKSPRHAAAAKNVGHGLGLHTDPLIHVHPMLRHRSRGKRRQPPAPSQHAAIGAQGLKGVQEPPAVHVCAPSPHADCGVIAHAPETKLQHTPG